MGEDVEGSQQESTQHEAAARVEAEKQPEGVDFWTGVLFLPQGVVDNIIKQGGVRELQRSALKLKEYVSRGTHDRDVERAMANFANNLAVVRPDADRGLIDKRSEFTLGKAAETVRRIAFEGQNMKKALWPFVDFPSALQCASDLKRGRPEPQIILKESVPGGGIPKEIGRLPLPERISKIYDESQFSTQASEV